jgi:hypothetical protein
MRADKRFYGYFVLCALFCLPSLSWAGALGLLNPPDPLNAAAEGMGEAVVADGTSFNATAYNPALLANTSHFCEIRLGFSLSNDVLGIINYASSNNNLTNLQNAFQNSGSYMQDIINGLTPLSPNVPEVNQGINGMQDTVNSVQTATSNLTGKTLALGAGLNIAMKFDDHWGFQIYSNAHAAVQINREALTQALLKISTLPTLQGGSATQVAAEVQAAWNDLGPVIQSAFPNQAVTLGQAVTALQSNQTSSGVTQFANSLSNVSGSITQNQLQTALMNDVALVTGLAYLDTVAMATYSFKPLEEETPLTVGVNFKVVHRNIAYANGSWLSQQDFNDLSNVGTELKNDLEQSTLRWGVDLGLLYEFKEEKLSVGLSAQDLLHSTATINAPSGDPLNGVVTDPAPVVVTAGASWHPIKPLVLNADMDDILSNTSTYQGLDFFSHFKLGTAFNVIDFLQLRGGFSNGNFSAGLGLPLMGLDYAYAVDDLTQVYTHYLQFKVVM